MIVGILMQMRIVKLYGSGFGGIRNEILYFGGLIDMVGVSLGR